MACTPSSFSRVVLLLVRDQGRSDAPREGTYAPWALLIEALGSTGERRSVVFTPPVMVVCSGPALLIRALDGAEERGPLQPGCFDMAKGAVLGVSDGGTGGCASGLHALSAIAVGVG